MIPYKYSYLIAGLVFLFIWLILFFKKPKYRGEMLLLGVIGLIMGPPVNQLLYLKDWWSPAYVVSMRVGIEDMLLGFTNIGIIAVLYEEVFNKNYTRNIEFENLNYTKAILRLFLYVFVSLGSILVLFYGFNIHTYPSSIIGLILGGILIISFRPDLIKDSLWTALLMPIVSLPAFIIPELLSPGWIDSHWIMENLSGIKILLAPAEDIVWYALTGFSLGSLFEYLFDFKIRAE